MRRCCNFSEIFPYVFAGMNGTTVQGDLGKKFEEHF